MRAGKGGRGCLERRRGRALSVEGGRSALRGRRGMSLWCLADKAFVPQAAAAESSGSREAAGGANEKSSKTAAETVRQAGVY